MQDRNARVQDSRLAFKGWNGVCLNTARGPECGLLLYLRGERLLLEISIIIRILFSGAGRM